MLFTNRINRCSFGEREGKRMQDFTAWISSSPLTCSLNEKHRWLKQVSLTATADGMSVIYRVFILFFTFLTNKWGEKINRLSCLRYFFFKTIETEAKKNKSIIDEVTVIELEVSTASFNYTLLVREKNAGKWDTWKFALLIQTSTTEGNSLVKWQGEKRGWRSSGKVLLFWISTKNHFFSSFLRSTRWRESNRFAFLALSLSLPRGSRRRLSFETIVPVDVSICQLSFQCICINALVSIFVKMINKLDAQVNSMLSSCTLRFSSFNRPNICLSKRIEEGRRRHWRINIWMRYDKKERNRHV